jgi:hypothetical protein
LTLSVSDETYPRNNNVIIIKPKVIMPLALLTLADLGYPFGVFFFQKPKLFGFQSFDCYRT